MERRLRSEKGWLRKAWRHTRAPSGVLVAHMDFWLQPLAFQRRVAKGLLPSDAIWTLAAGLNAPPTGPPPAPQHLRIYGKGCLSFEDLVNEQDWTWGHGVRDFAKEAARELGTAGVRAAQADLFHAPRPAFFVPREGGSRLRRRRARGRRADDPSRGGGVSETTLGSCWTAGAARSRGARTPRYFGGHACGPPSWTYGGVRSAWRALLDAQAAKLGAKRHPRPGRAAAPLDRGSATTRSCRL